jgi:signal transduction histidine kinase
MFVSAPPDRPGDDRAWPGGPPPAQVRWLRAFGVAMILLTMVVTATTDPQPGLEGRRLAVSIGLALFAVSVFSGGPWWRRPPRLLPLRLAGLMAASFVLLAVQPKGFGVAGVYLVVVIAALRLPTPQALVAVGVAVGGTAVVALAFDRHPGDIISSTALGVIPWFLVISMIKRLRLGQLEAEALVAELHETREAHARAAALDERGRLARDMHDVLAHSLSALSLQLEGARMLARDRDADPEVTAAIERAHRLAGSGLEEARRAIGALRGDDLPGPERLSALAESFRGPDGAGCAFTATGEARELPADARLAVYRTAQEALTNVARHSRPERVELRLDYAPDGTSLVVADHGRVNGSHPPAAGAGGGGGYGLTGMRERAELLGGRLDAGPTRDGFEVRLWLPA